MPLAQKTVLLVGLLIQSLGCTQNPNPDLIRAARSRDIAAVRALLAKGADVNAKDKNGSTALMLVASRGHTDALRALLAAGANVNAKDIGGGTALMGAVMYGHTAAAEALLAAGGQTPERATLAEMDALWDRVKAQPWPKWMHFGIA